MTKKIHAKSGRPQKLDEVAKRAVIDYVMRSDHGTDEHASLRACRNEIQHQAEATDRRRGNNISGITRKTVDSIMQELEIKAAIRKEKAATPTVPGVTAPIPVINPPPPAPEHVIPTATNTTSTRKRKGNSLFTDHVTQ